jgi:hypothetical protein
MFNKRCLATAASSLAVLSLLASTCSQTPSSRARIYETRAANSDLEQRIQGFFNIGRAFFWQSVSENPSTASSMRRTLPHQADAKSFGNPCSKARDWACKSKQGASSSLGAQFECKVHFKVPRFAETSWGSECSTTSPYSPAANKSAPQHVPATLPTEHGYL